MHICAHVSAGAHGIQKAALDFLELEAEVAVSRQTWALGTKLRFVLLMAQPPPQPFTLYCRGHNNNGCFCCFSGTWRPAFADFKLAEAPHTFTWAYASVCWVTFDTRGTKLYP